MKKLFRAPHRGVSGRGLLIAIVVLVATAGTALAATLNGGQGNVTIIGTPNGQDKITAGAGNDVIWGLGGSDAIKVGSGNDQIDADGHCSGGFDTVTPNPSSSGDYCSHGHDGDTDSTGNSITAGNGNDTIFGGVGDNSIAAGSGDDTIYGSPTASDAITAGVGSVASDTINLGTGTNSVSVGYGANVINAFHAGDTKVDTIACQSRNSTAYVNAQDKVNGCHAVIVSSARDAAWLKSHRRRHKHHKHHKHHKKSQTF